MISIKVHDTYRKVVAICDSELLGKKFEEGIAQLYLKESFYKGDEVDEEKAVTLIRRYHRDDATFNIVGKMSVKAAVKAQLINEECIGKISNIPYILILL